MDFVHFKEFYAAGILWIKKNYKYPYTKKNLPISGPKQFESMLLESQMYIVQA